MNRTHRQGYTVAVLGVLLVALGAARPALAAVSTLESGMPGSVGNPDPDTDFSGDGGATFNSAVIITPIVSYSTIPGTQWISSSGATPSNSDTIFRTFFALPLAFFTPSLTTQVHSDNAATVFLNGASIGAQPQAEIAANFQDPAEIFGTSNAALFLAGQNELRYVVHNFGGPMGLDYLATVTYEDGNGQGVIPEPSSLLLMGLGGLVMARRRLKRTASA